jgi:BirA family biotin operon repressor/biotin-[acetyl-CoA-carboxylase] ligase
MEDTLTFIGRDRKAREQLAGLWGIARFDFHDSVESTQNVARTLAMEQAPEWTIVVADRQTAGRGQHGRKWQAGDGSSLMFSLLLRPRGIEETALMPIRIGLAIARAIDRFLAHGRGRPGKTMLKWPNDLVVGNGKVGGILCEGQATGTAAWIIVGVGINIGRFPVHLPDRRFLQAAFLEEYLRPRTTRLDLLEAIIASLHADLPTRMGELDDAEMRDYFDRDWLYGHTLKSPVAGKAVGITRNGHLRVLKPDGSEEPVIAGHIVLDDHQ